MRGQSRRGFLTGSAALAAYAQVREAKALTAAQRLAFLGGSRKTPATTPSLNFSNARNSQYLVLGMI